MKISMSRRTSRLVTLVAVPAVVLTSISVASASAWRSHTQSSSHAAHAIVDTSTLRVRQVSGGGTFYDAKTGKPFIPRGADYIRVAQNALHSTFVNYNGAEATRAMVAMHKDGYNVVRVYLPFYAIASATSQTLNPVVIAHVADFLRRANAAQIKVLLTSDGLPSSPAWTPAPLAQSVDPNSNVFNPSELALAKVQVKDLFTGLAADKAPLNALFGYELQNEQDFAYSLMPFEVPSTKVVTVSAVTPKGLGASSQFTINPDGTVTSVTSGQGGAVPAVGKVSPTYRADEVYVGWTKPSTSVKITGYRVSVSFSSPYTSQHTGSQVCAEPRSTLVKTVRTPHIFVTGLGMPYLCSIKTTDGRTYSLAAKNHRTQNAATVTAMEANNLLYWQNSLASFTHHLVPNLLLCLGTFPPMGATLGLTSLPQVDLSKASKVDFIDMHFYPSYGGSVKGHPTLAQNFAAQVRDLSMKTSQITKPVLMAEFGVWKPSPGAPAKWVVPSATAAAKELQQWQIISCSVLGLHVDGWMVWTWDTSLKEKTPGNWSMVDGGGAIARALSPKLRPNACRA